MIQLFSSAIVVVHQYFVLFAVLLTDHSSETFDVARIRLRLPVNEAFDCKGKRKVASEKIYALFWVLDDAFFYVRGHHRVVSVLEMHKFDRRVQYHGENDE